MNLWGLFQATVQTTWDFVSPGGAPASDIAGFKMKKASSTLFLQGTADVTQGGSPLRQLQTYPLPSLVRWSLSAAARVPETPSDWTGREIYLSKEAFCGPEWSKERAGKDPGQTGKGRACWSTTHWSCPGMQVPLGQGPIIFTPHHLEVSPDMRGSQ